MHAVKAMVESYTGMTVDTAEMLSIDRLGMTTRCTRQGQSLKARVAWPREVTDRKAVKEVIVEMTRAAAGAKAEAK